ncbi:unnamed protein product [Gadus morhua 'NCC']
MSSFGAAEMETPVEGGDLPPSAVRHAAARPGTGERRSAKVSHLSDSLEVSMTSLPDPNPRLIPESRGSISPITPHPVPLPFSLLLWLLAQQTPGGGRLLLGGTIVFRTEPWHHDEAYGSETLGAAERVSSN